MGTLSVSVARRAGRRGKDRNARRRKRRRCRGCGCTLPDYEGRGNRPDRCDECTARRKALRLAIARPARRCRDCGCDLPDYAGKGNRPQRCPSCRRGRDRRRQATCEGCGRFFRYTPKRSNSRPRTRCDTCAGSRRQCHGCGLALEGRALKWCDGCRPTSAERNRSYYERNKEKVKRRVARNRLKCGACGARLLRAAARCGFCEAEDPTRPPPVLTQHPAFVGG